MRPSESPHSSQDLTRRSALACGAALSLLSVLPRAAQADPNTAAASGVWTTLSGRLTNAQGQPVRAASLQFGPFNACTDADGRFFLNAELAADQPLSVQVTDRDRAWVERLRANPQWLRHGSQLSANLSLTLAG
jgi:hypothetical protein